MLLPITYALMIFFYYLIRNNEEQYQNRLLSKFLGSLLGVWLAINTWNGFYWISDTTGTFVVTQVKDGFQLPVTLIILGMALFTIIMTALSIVQQDWKKQTNENPNR